MALPSSPSNSESLPILLTVQGQARSGKGTLARALTADLRADHDVVLIDQGLKFRVIADEYLKAGGDIEDVEAIGIQLIQPDFYERVLRRLSAVSTMAKQELDTVYYTPVVNNASGMVGKSQVAQKSVLQLLEDEIKRARDTGIIILDGRAWTEKGKVFERDGLVRYPLAIDVSCSSLTAARRLTKLFGPLDSLSQAEAVALLKQVVDIDNRNSADARRPLYPSLPISGALLFDVLHRHTEAELASACNAARKIGALSVDNSYTRTEEQFTAPVVRLVRQILSPR